MKLVEPEKTAEAWQRTGGPPRSARWLGRHPVLSALAAMLWFAPLLVSAWSQSRVVFTGSLAMTLVFCLGVFLVSRGFGAALDAFEKRTPAALAPQPEAEETEEERWRQSKQELGFLVVAIGGVFFGAIWLAIGVASSSDRPIHLWTGLMYLLLGVVFAVNYARRRRGPKRETPL